MIDNWQFNHFIDSRSFGASLDKGMTADEIDDWIEFGEYLLMLLIHTEFSNLILLTKET